MLILTARRDNVEPDPVPRKRRRHLLGHVRHGGLAGRVRKVRHGDAAVGADGAGDDHLAALGHAGPVVARRQQRQEGRDAEVHGADVDAEGLVERRRVDVPELLLVLRERGGGRRLRDGARDARVGDQEVDVPRLLGDLRDYAFQVRLGACVALQGDDISVLLPLISVPGRRF